MKLQKHQHNFLVECDCGNIRRSAPIPDGDEICEDCGHKEMWDYEGEVTEELSKLLDWEEVEEIPQFKGTREDLDNLTIR